MAACAPLPSEEEEARERGVEMSPRNCLCAVIPSCLALHTFQVILLVGQSLDGEHPIGVGWLPFPAQHMDIS